MPAAPNPHPSLDPESEEYKRLWAEGLRPVVLWLPDPNDQNAAAELQREAREIAACTHEDEDMEFIESVQIFFEE